LHGANVVLPTLPAMAAPDQGRHEANAPKPNISELIEAFHAQKGVPSQGLER
jgi:hypothetical protein